MHLNQIHHHLKDKLDIFEDDKENGRWVKHIRFKIPISYKDNEEVLDYYPDDNSVIDLLSCRQTALIGCL